MIVNPTAPANSEGDSFPRDAERAALFHNVLGQHQLLLKRMRDQGEPDRDPPPEPYYSEEAGDVPPQGQDYEVESEPSPETASEGVISGSAKPPVGMDVARIKEHFGIPNLDELDILNAPVDDGNPDTPDPSLTDKAWIALIEDYRERIESGDLEKDSPQARLVRALDAKAALEQGHEIWAYREDAYVFDFTVRNFDDAPTHLTPADMEAFFKEGAVDEALAELLTDEGILADYESALQDELDRLPDEAKSEIVAQIEELVSSPEYAQYLSAMREAGHEEFAQRELSRMLNSLKALAPEKVEEVTEKLAWNAVNEDFMSLLDDPDRVPQEHKDQAVADYFLSINAALRQLPNMGRNVEGITDVIDYISNRFNSDATFRGQFNAALDAYRRTGSLPADASDDIKGAFSVLKKIGVLDGVVSASFVVSAIYAIFGAGVDSPEDRIALARYVLGAMGVASDPAGLINVALRHLDSLTSLDGNVFEGIELETLSPRPPDSPPPGTPTTPETASPDPTTDEWEAGSSGVADEPERQSPAPQTPDPNGNWDWEEFLVNHFDTEGSDVGPIDATVPVSDVDVEAPGSGVSVSDVDVEASGSGVQVSDPDVDTSTPGEWDEIFDEVFEQLDQDLEELSLNPFGEPDPTQGSTPGSTDSSPVPDTPRPSDPSSSVPDTPNLEMPSKLSVILRSVGTLADVGGGVLDIVLGAMTIDQAVKNPTEGPTDELLISSGALGVGTGVLGLGSTIAAFTTSALAGPLAVVSIFFAGISSILGAVAQHTAMQEMTDQEGQWFKDLADDGLLKEDWGDILEYHRYAISWYGSRDAPEDVSMIDFQSEEWRHFQDTEPENGSSTNRLNPELHDDYDNSNSNPYDSEGIPDITLGI